MLLSFTPPKVRTINVLILGGVFHVPMSGEQRLLFKQIEGYKN